MSRARDSKVPLDKRARSMGTPWCVEGLQWSFADQQPWPGKKAGGGYEIGEADCRRGRPG